ncbi:translation initiation factor IF-3 [Candidatus Electronema sp. JM]|uniref:translation initiation factor IF-3 n=1 Tax=Candidatus Electronema sp. JM TaxID=3401571 RepID=UPI003AA7DFFF
MDSKRKPKKGAQQEIRVRINDDIRYPEVRLLGPEGEQLGVMSSAKARQIALEQGLDLVEISDKASPPVCRVMNFDKYRYELKKKQQEAKKKQTVVETKEVKFRPKTEDHDLDFKIKNILKFVEKKNKVKITMQFRGREIVHAQTVGMEAIKHIADALREHCAIIQEPTMEGRFMIMFVGPKP